MGTPNRVVALAAVAALVGACRPEPGGYRSPLHDVTSDVIGFPVTTSSDAARNHFLQGLRDADLGRFIEANDHFMQTVAADSTFAFGYLSFANNANSLKEFKDNLALAERHAAGASHAEQLLIQMARKGFENDLEGQLALGKQLAEMHGDSPRAWIALGDVQQAMNRVEEARASYAKALELAPRMFLAHTQLGNSYLFVEPRDFAKALEHMQHAANLALSEPWPHDLLGDVYRAQNDLEKAAEEYTRAHELSPDDASPLQQRGHVHSFLGRYEAARADYDSAIARGRANEKPSFAMYRAFVHVHADEPQAAIDELNRLVASIDGMGAPEPRGSKIEALSSAAIIAIHTRNFAAADQALRQRSALMLQAAGEVGTDAFRRSQQANIAYFDGWLAARKGDYATTRRMADRITKLVEPDANPRKMEGVHQLLGFIALYQGRYREAIGHFDQGDPNDMYVRYQLALASEGAGNVERAKKLFREVAINNFNDVGVALTRKEATQKAR
jgi:tetratricopeptide (TPR) repeat protein